MMVVCAFIMQNGQTTVIVAKNGKEEKIMKARYPEGVSADRSLHRAEGDV